MKRSKKRRTDNHSLLELYEMMLENRKRLMCIALPFSIIFAIVLWILFPQQWWAGLIMLLLGFCSIGGWLYMRHKVKKEEEYIEKCSKPKTEEEGEKQKEEPKF